MATHSHTYTQAKKLCLSKQKLFLQPRMLQKLWFFLVAPPWINRLSVIPESPDPNCWSLALFPPLKLALVVTSWSALHGWDGPYSRRAALFMRLLWGHIGARNGHIPPGLWSWHWVRGTGGGSRYESGGRVCNFARALSYNNNIW